MVGVACRGWQLCRGLGGNLPVDWVAGFVWIGWQPSRGLGGRNPWNTQQLCKLFSFTVKHRATLLPVQRPSSQEGAQHRCAVGFMGITVVFRHRIAQIEYKEDRCIYGLISLGI